MELIDKSVIVAVIKKKLDKYSKLHSFNYGAVKDLESLLDFLDTFEVKEVNLEKEVRKFIKDNGTSLEEPDEFLTTVMQLDDMVMFAKYFYELGLKQNKD